MTSRLGGIYDGNMMPRTSRPIEDGDYRVEVEVTWLNRAIKPVDVRLISG